MKENKEVGTKVGVEKLTFPGKTLEEIKAIAEQMNKEAREKAEKSR